MFANIITFCSIVAVCYTQYADNTTKSEVQTRFYNIIVQRNPGSDTRDLMCSGVLISYNTVLTVAHCFFNSTGAMIPTEKFAILLGDPAKNNHVIPVKSIRVHPEYRYNPPERLNDIAVVILQDEIGADTVDVVPIGLATYRMPPGVKCYISTWLNLLYSSSFSTTIQKVPVVLVDPAYCSLEVEKWERTICMNGNDTDLDGTYFLSGSPLVCNNVLAGLSFQTIRSTALLEVESFTNINFYWPWITKSKANSMGCTTYVWIVIYLYIGKIIRIG